MSRAVMNHRVSHCMAATTADNANHAGLKACEAFDEPKAFGTVGKRFRSAVPPSGARVKLPLFA